MWEEIEKCIPLCCNCHRIYHWMEKEEKRMSDLPEYFAIAAKIIERRARFTARQVDAWRS